MNTQTSFNWADRAPLLNRLRWNWAQEDDSPGRASGKIAIVGLPGVGKKTLCNTLWGWEAVTDAPEMIRNFGLFTLVDLPADPADTATVTYKLEGVDLIVYVLDATQPLSGIDFGWISRLRTQGASLVIAANRIDRLPDAQVTPTLNLLRERTARPVLPLNAAHTSSVQQTFIPALLRYCPEVSYALAGEVRALRRRVMLYLIVRSALTGLMAQAQVGSTDDTQLLLQVQTQMIRRIATLHGQPETAFKRMEFILNQLLRLHTSGLLRAARWLAPGKVWFMSHLAAILSTLLVAGMAVIYYGVVLQPHESARHASQQSTG